MQRTQPDGHLALPSTRGGGAVLVLHAWWGLNGTMKALCARLAGSGFAAFAPDLYHGKTADTIEGAERLSGALDADGAKAEITQAVTFLVDRDRQVERGGQADPGGRADRGGQADRGLAVIGFSLGAYFALDLSVADPERVRSVVIFYGTGPADFSRARAAYLGHFAEKDPYEPTSEVDKLEAALRSAGRPVTFHRYAGTGHWFFEPDRSDAFDAAAASLAWDRTLEFLRSASSA